jgi:hypothetical protein
MDGITFEATPMLVHVRRFKAFLLYYRSKMCWNDGPTDDDVMQWNPKNLTNYCCTQAYHDDCAIHLKSSKQDVSYDGIGATANGTSGTSSIIYSVKIHKLHLNGIQNRMLCQDLLKDNYSKAWNQGFVAATHMDCTHSILNESNIPKDDREKVVS